MTATADTPSKEGATQPQRRPLSLGVIFLTLLIDLIGFSIIFPLGPDLITYYLRVDAGSGPLGWIMAQSEAAAHALGRDHAFAREGGDHFDAEDAAKRAAPLPPLEALLPKIPGLTPELDALGKRSVRFTHAYSAAPWTRPGTVAMLAQMTRARPLSRT